MEGLEVRVEGLEVRVEGLEMLFTLNTNHSTLYIKGADAVTGISQF